MPTLPCSRARVLARTLLYESTKVRVFRHEYNIPSYEGIYIVTYLRTLYNYIVLLYEGTSGGTVVVHVHVRVHYVFCCFFSNLLYVYTYVCIRNELHVFHSS